MEERCGMEERHCFWGVEGERETKVGTGTVGLLKESHTEEDLMRAPRLGRCHRASQLDSSEGTGSHSCQHPSDPAIIRLARMILDASTRLSPTALAAHGEGDVNIKILTADLIQYNVLTRNGDKNIQRCESQLSKDRPISTVRMDLGWHENRLRAPTPRLIIMFFHFVSMQSRSVRKPPLAERALIRCLTRTISNKQKSQFYRPAPFRFPFNRKSSLRVYVRLQPRVTRKASLTIGALVRSGNQRGGSFDFNKPDPRPQSKNLSSPDFQMDCLYVPRNKMSLVPALTAGFFFAWSDVRTPIFRCRQLLYILIPGLARRGRGRSPSRRLWRTLLYRRLVVIVTRN